MRKTPPEFVIGFDGSKGRKRGRADSTALVAIRLEDAALWIVGHWEDPQTGRPWTPPRGEIIETVEACFDAGAVGGRMDPAGGWGPEIAEWENRYRAQLWTPKLAFASSHYQAQAYERLREAIEARTIRVDFDRDPKLREHFLSGFGTDGAVQKEHSGPTAGLIDLLAASAYAWRAYLDALANRPPPPKKRASRIMV